MAGPFLGGLFQGMPAAAPPKPKNFMDPNYAGDSTDPKDMMAKMLEQQHAIKMGLFQPVYDKAAKSALDANAPTRAARDAARWATKQDAITRAQFLRMQERQGSAMDPAAVQAAAKEQRYQKAQNISDAAFNAYQDTYNNQSDQLSSLVQMGIDQQRQALGLATNAASQFGTRQAQDVAARNAQANANAANQQQNISYGITAVTTAASIGVGIAIL